MMWKNKGGAREATDEKMWFVCLMTKARVQTHTDNFKYLLLFHTISAYMNAPQYYVIHTLPVFIRMQDSNLRQPP